MQQISIVFYNSDNDDNMVSLVYTDWLQHLTFDISDNRKQWEGEHFGQVSCNLSFFLTNCFLFMSDDCVDIRIWFIVYRFQNGVTKLLD